jgi:hypothetical protein
MKTLYDVTPSTEDYVCMVDVYGRAGHLNDAEHFINQLDKPDVLLYKALLGACRVHNDVERAERVGKAILSRTPTDVATYILLYTIYTANRLWEKASEIKDRLKKMDNSSHGTKQICKIE